MKAQIHAGGRGKAGGIQLASTPEEARERAERLLGERLVTHQTGPEGKEVRRVLVEEQSDIAREVYVGVALDTSTSLVSVMACAEGGVEIEEVARRSPEKILKIPVDPAYGFFAFQARSLAADLGLPYESWNFFASLLQGLVRSFVECDCLLVEINPLILNRRGKLIALDTKMNFDDNGLFRHPDIGALRDTGEEDPKETRAAEFGLSYIALEGNIGCMVNGAGLAMATMDIIKLYGGEPANFLDVGGGANKEKVAQAFRLILSDPRVRGILVNIFGGIMRCDVIAEGVVEAARELGIAVPLVVRLQGTNVDLGRELLSRSGLSLISADAMSEAAEKIVQAVQGSQA